MAEGLVALMVMVMVVMVKAGTLQPACIIHDNLSPLINKYLHFNRSLTIFATPDPTSSSSPSSSSIDIKLIYSNDKRNMIVRPTFSKQIPGRWRKYTLERLNTGGEGQEMLRVTAPEVMLEQKFLGRVGVKVTRVTSILWTQQCRPGNTRENELLDDGNENGDIIVNLDKKVHDKDKNKETAYKIINKKGDEPDCQTRDKYIRMWRLAFGFSFFVSILMTWALWENVKRGGLRYSPGLSVAVVSQYPGRQADENTEPPSPLVTREMTVTRCPGVSTM